MSARKDAKALARFFTREGYSVHETATGHYHVRDQEGVFVTHFGKTPSDTRSIANAMAKYKRYLRGRPE